MKFLTTLLVCIGIIAALLFTYQHSVNNTADQLSTLMNIFFMMIFNRLLNLFSAKVKPHKAISMNKVLLVVLISLFSTLNILR